MSDNLQRIVEFSPAFDKRDPNPRKDYGVHGVELLMLVLGEKGAIQFKLITNWMLPHVQIEQDERTLQKAHTGLLDKYDLSALYHPMPADLGYHSKVPIYEDQEPLTDDCKWTGGVCYYDGSGLNAEPVFELLLTKGSDAVWKLLEERYYEQFSDVS